ncbi:MAG TPA: nucleotide exchange factor GrpE [Nitratifractor sp.]|nr:nucleotide exchange factor GrpE [Nitratifractor sp.]HHH20320.1 nucleotide exchange factor GrpE [Nitratifractor sp.]
MANNEEKVQENIEDQETQEKSETSQEVDELTKCQEELAGERDKFLRAHADFENMKKRIEKEKHNALIYANEAFAKDLLTVLDTFENGLKSVEQVDANETAIEEIKKGMILTYEQLLSILKKHGIEEVECEGEFNPEFHQAVTQMDSEEHNSGDIVQVLQKGYKLKERLLRASMVATCK